MSGTSFENLEPGAFNPRLNDLGEDEEERVGAVNPEFFWHALETNELAEVTAYEAGAAYDYAAHGTERHAYLESEEPGADKYLMLTADTGLDRAIFARFSPDDPFSNVVIRTGTRDSIYCDTLVKFTAGECVPEYDDTARLVVWARLYETDDGDLYTNLMVTAGCYTNGMSSVATRDYRLDFDLDLSRWYRLTIRAHGDVTESGVGIGGFSVLIDGQPVACLSEDYDGIVAKSSWFRPEARALLSLRRLFPGLSKPGSDAAFTVSGLTFFGDGLIDDVTFSSGDPGFGAPEAVFTFNWDAGFSVLKYTLDGLVTNEAPLLSARSSDILIGSAPTNGLTLRVTDFTYNEGDGWKPGVWLGENGATLTNGVDFVYDGTTRNPIATVASTRDSVHVGAGGFDTFVSALAALDRSTNDVKVLELCGDTTVAKTKARDAYGNRDTGSVKMDNADGDYVLDLCGHTLRGSSRTPTLVVNCKALRIIDSSVEKSGRVLPVGLYTNESMRLNTAVQIYPAARDPETGGLVEPQVTIQGGIYDGWVRNDGLADDAAGGYRTGVLFIEAGSFISTNEATFYLDSCVTNRTMHYGYRSGYWSSITTNAYIWTGAGDGVRWDNPWNWKSESVPKAGSTALFPSRPEGTPPWTVNVGDNDMTTTNLWLEGDIALSGTNDFTNVRLESTGAGRIGGDATLIYDGTPPGKLTVTTLRDDWTGTVHLKNIGQSLPKALVSPETWGNARSTVIFNGVRGYFKDSASHTMDYDLTLRDEIYLNASGKLTTNLAWRIDSGYSGSTIAFKKRLLGDGTFMTGSAKGLQLFKFADVREFAGRFDVQGQRVVLGSDTVSASAAGLLAFGEYVTVSAGLGWSCKNAVFGEHLQVWGDTNDVLVTCTVSEPDIVCCSNMTLNGHTDVAWLACATNLTAKGAKTWSIYVSGERPPWIPEPDPSLTSLAPAAVFATMAAPAANDTSYAAAALRAAATAQAMTAVDMAEVAIGVGDETVELTVSNASRGLWYGARYRSSLDADWESPKAWVQATDTTVTLSYEKPAESGFYGVVVSIEDPLGGGGSGD